MNRQRNTWRGEATLVQVRIRYADVVATLALFVALGGGAYAAMSIPARSVGTTQLKRGAVGTAELRRGAVTLTKIAVETQSSLRGRRGAAGAVGAAGPQGPAGMQGPTGPRGATGPAGVGASPINYVAATTGTSHTVYSHGGLVVDDDCDLPGVGGNSSLSAETTAAGRLVLSGLHGITPFGEDAGITTVGPTYGLFGVRGDSGAYATADILYQRSGEVIELRLFSVVDAKACHVYGTAFATP